MDEDGFSLSEARVTIVGLGLMGASLAMDLRGHCAEIIGVSRSPETLNYALEQHIVDRITDFDSALDCDLLVLAAPVRTIIRQLQQISNLSSNISSPRQTVIIDLGSTKSEIVNAMQALPTCFDPIGGHPMCGKEVAGIRSAETGLYRDKIFVLTPLERTSARGQALVSEMIEIIGSVPLVLPPEQQDMLVAATSHLPYLAACALMRMALAKEDGQLWSVAASGFRDSSRLAASDLTMMMDILLTNRKAILDSLNDYRAELDTLAALLESGNEEDLCTALSPAQQQRSQLFK
ncbi:MAG: prephenate dehydrogenase/arogenate dehydrogenase family protein [Chloroflexota bacterium]